MYSRKLTRSFYPNLNLLSWEVMKMVNFGLKIHLTRKDVLELLKSTYKKWELPETFLSICISSSNPLSDLFTLSSTESSIRTTGCNAELIGYYNTILNFSFHMNRNSGFTIIHLFSQFEQAFLTLFKDIGEGVHWSSHPWLMRIIRQEGLQLSLVGIFVCLVYPT